jgi:hypothetical protein
MNPPDPEGESVYVASESGTWSVVDSAWDTYRKHGGQPGQVFQGIDLYGAWFYNGGPAELEAVNVVGAEINLGLRLPVGNYNDPVMLQMWIHTSEDKPDGVDVTRTLGPYEVLIPGGLTENHIELPELWAPEFVTGAGVSLQGNELVGFTSRNDYPTSGLLTLEWETPTEE